MQHPEEGIIHAWLDGALPAKEAAAIEAHVASCAECAVAVADARGLIAASSRIVGHLDAVPGKVIPASRPKRRLISWRNSWVAAIAAGLILMVRGYLTWPGNERHEPQVTAASDAKPASPPLADSAVARPVANQVAAGAPSVRQPSRPEPTTRSNNIPGSLSDSLASLALPRAGAALQKRTIAAAEPTAAPRPAELSTAQRAARARDENVKVEAMVVTSSAANAPSRATVGGNAAGAAAPPAAVERSFAVQADVAPAAFIGCYEMNASTEVLPARFALTGDSASIHGLLAVRYIDTDGKPTAPIADLGWSVEGGRIIVRTRAQEPLLTLRRTGSVAVGESRSGSRSGRVISCTR